MPGKRRLLSGSSTIPADPTKSAKCMKAPPPWIGWHRSRRGARPLVLQLPNGVESDFVGVLDLVGFKAIKWREETLGAQFDIVEVPPEMVAEAKTFRARLVEAAVEQDDAALEAYLGGEEPSEQTLKHCIRKGTIGGAFIPGLCGSALKNKGGHPLLEAVVA